MVLIHIILNQGNVSVSVTFSLCPRVANRLSGEQPESMTIRHVKICCSVEQVRLFVIAATAETLPFFELVLGYAGPPPAPDSSLKPGSQVDTWAL